MKPWPQLITKTANAMLFVNGLAAAVAVSREAHDKFPDLYVGHFTPSARIKGDATTAWSEVHI